MFKHARCELEIITQPLQLVCTGEFYDKWIDEEKPLPIPALISIISLLVHGIFTIMIMIIVPKVLSKTGDVESALAKLEKAHQRLTELDRLQQYISPLTKRKIDLEREIGREEAKLTAQLEQLHHAARKLAEDIEKVLLEI